MVHEDIEMKIVTIIGARPQFIKAAPVSQQFRALNGVREVIVHTGQHHDANMSDVFFDELGIQRPDWHLGIAGGTHGAMTGQMLEAIEKVLLKESPDWVLVYGDTNSTLAGGLAAAKLHVPIAHVEAGLRSFNRRMPEEINRILVDHLSSMLFAPTITAVDNLKLEGLGDDLTHLVGDVMYDAVRYFGPISQEKSHILADLKLEAKSYVLATIHRAENTDHPARLSRIVDELIALSASLPVIFPVHPRTRKLLDQARILEKVLLSLVVTDPLGYLDMIALERAAAVIATDSGGVQKEAYFHQVPCVTLRDETEWVELIETDWNRLCPPTIDAPIASTILAAVGTRGTAGELYGDGNAAQTIVNLLTSGA
jgi:UDP-GlcNAc3NAcA epimerase